MTDHRPDVRFKVLQAEIESLIERSPKLRVRYTEHVDSLSRLKARARSSGVDFAHPGYSEYLETLLSGPPVEWFELADNESEGAIDG